MTVPKTVVLPLHHGTITEPPIRLERMTCSLQVSCSSQLSYGGKKKDLEHESYSYRACRFIDALFIVFLLFHPVCSISFCFHIYYIYGNFVKCHKQSRSERSGSNRQPRPWKGRVLPIVLLSLILLGINNVKNVSFVMLFI